MTLVRGTDSAERLLWVSPMKFSRVNLRIDARIALAGLYDALVTAVAREVLLPEASAEGSKSQPPARTGDTMTETHEMEALTEALSIIDRALGEMLHRELVSTNEVADLLLDIRTLVASEAAVLVQS